MTGARDGRGDMGSMAIEIDDGMQNVGLSPEEARDERRVAGDE
jgi:hypothetical protein